MNNRGISPHPGTAYLPSFPPADGLWGGGGQPQTRLLATLGAARAGGLSGTDGRFLPRLPALEAGGHYDLSVEGLDGTFCTQGETHT